MLGVGAPEVVLISFVALLVFGPDRLAGAAREWGAALGKVRRRLDEARAELASADYPDEWFEDGDGRQEDLFDKDRED